MPLTAILLGAACGTPPNARLLTRTQTYIQAISLASDTGHPFDIDKLVRRFPELKGIVITAPQWIDEYEVMLNEAKRKGTSVYEYKIPFGTHLTIEVTGEPQLSRRYYVAPTGFVHYPYLGKLRVAGLTVDVLKQDIEEKLAVYLRKPEVLIHITATQYQPSPDVPFVQQSIGGGEIVVLGATTTRFYNNIGFTGKETLLNVLGKTGLPSNTEWRQIRVIRRSAEDPLRKSRIIVCDLWDYFVKADVRQDIPLFPGDVVYVPIRWSADDQFWEDWGYVKRIIDDVFFIDTFRDGVRKGGELRD